MVPVGATSGLNFMQTQDTILKTGRTRVADVPKGVVTPQDVDALGRIDEIELELMIATQEKRDEFESILAGRMPALMPMNPMRRAR